MYSVEGGGVSQPHPRPFPPKGGKGEMHLWATPCTRNGDLVPSGVYPPRPAFGGRGRGV